MIYELLSYTDRLKIRMFIESVYRRDLHFHSEMEILYVLDGSVMLMKGGESTLLRKGDVFFLESETLHGLQGTKEANSLLVLQFDVKFCESYFQDFRGRRLNRCLLTPNSEGMGYAHTKDALRGFLELQGREAKRKRGYTFQMMARLNQLCATLVEDVGLYEPRKEEGTAQQRDLNRLAKIIAFVNRNYMYKITLKEIAERENLNMSYLSHFVARNLGMPLQRYLTLVRMQSAADLLAYTDKRIIDVCVECGFSDSRYLNRIFLREYGMTARQFRRERGAVCAPWSATVGLNQQVTAPVPERMHQIMQQLH